MEKFIKAISIPEGRLNSIDAQIYMREMYDIQYGIFDHIENHKHRPLSTVAMFNEEDVSVHPLLDREIEYYLLLEVYKYTGLTINEWLSYPPYIKKTLSERIERYVKYKTKFKNDLLNELENDGITE